MAPLPVYPTQSITPDLVRVAIDIRERFHRGGQATRLPHDPERGPESRTRLRRHPRQQSVRGCCRSSRIKEELANVEVARALYAMRTQAGLSQRQLAKLVGTTASVICRLEDADYAGHSLAMLRRIAAVLKQRVEIRFVPAGHSAQAGGMPG